MPILNVNAAKGIIVIKRSLGHGYAGIDNELYADPKTAMLQRRQRGSHRAPDRAEGVPPLTAEWARRRDRAAPRRRHEASA